MITLKTLRAVAKQYFRLLILCAGLIAASLAAEHAHAQSKKLDITTYPAGDEFFANGPDALPDLMSAVPNAIPLYNNQSTDVADSSAEEEEPVVDRPGVTDHYNSTGDDVVIRIPR